MDQSLVFRDRSPYSPRFPKNPRDFGPYLVFRVLHHQSPQAGDEVSTHDAEFLLSNAPGQPRQRRRRSRRVNRLRRVEPGPLLRSPFDEVARMGAPPRGLSALPPRALALLATANLLPITYARIRLEPVMTDRTPPTPRRAHPRNASAASTACTVADVARFC
jgi:hypothetical protein